MRVEPGNAVEPRSRSNPNGCPLMGQVYCVEDFWEGPQFNVVMLVGFGGWQYSERNGMKIGWRAVYFRKVDEIALCVRALEKAGILQDVSPEP